MLNSLRDGTKSGFLKFILIGFMVFAVGGLVLTDVGGFFRTNISANTIAEGKNIEISTVQFDRTVRRILAQQNIPVTDAYQFGIIQQILQGEIQASLLTNAARKNGIAVSDQDVLTAIDTLVTPLASNSAAKKEVLSNILRSQGISEPEFIQTLREELTRNSFSQSVMAIPPLQNTSLAQTLARYLIRYPVIN